MWRGEGGPRKAEAGQKGPWREGKRSVLRGAMAWWLGSTEEGGCAERDGEKMEEVRW